MALSDDLERIAEAAAALAAPGERVTGILAAEPLRYGRVYLCAYASGDERPAWLALDADGAPVTSLAAVREAAKLAALCEIAEETAGGGDLAELRARLRELRETEAPEGIEAAEAARRRARGHARRPSPGSRRPTISTGSAPRRGGSSRRSATTRARRSPPRCSRPCPPWTRSRQRSRSATRDR